MPYYWHFTHQRLFEEYTNPKEFAWRQATINSEKNAIERPLRLFALREVKDQAGLKMLLAVVNSVEQSAEAKRAAAQGIVDLHDKEIPELAGRFKVHPLHWTISGDLFVRPGTRGTYDYKVPGRPKVKTPRATNPVTKKALASARAHHRKKAVKKVVKKTTAKRKAAPKRVARRLTSSPAKGRRAR